MELPAAISIGAPREDQLSDFARKTRCVYKGHPAALAQAKEIHPTAQLIHHYVEIGEVIIDQQKAHVRTGRAPVRDENAPDPCALQRRNQAMAGSKIGYRRSVQCEWRANQDWQPLDGRRKIPQPHGYQFKGYPILCHPLWFTSAGLRLWCNGEADNLPRRGRCKFAGGFCDEGRPQENRRREL